MTPPRTSPFAGVYASGKRHWQYRISLPAGPDGKRRQEVRGGFRTDEDAHFTRQRRMQELGLGEDIPDDRMTVRAWLDQFLASHELNVDEQTIYIYHGWAKHIAPLDTVKLRDLTVPRVQRWIDALARDRSPNVAKNARMLLVMALNEAIRQRLLTTNVAHLTRTPRTETQPKPMYTTAQIRCFAEHAERHDLAAAWYLMLLCQLRPGEVVGLRWPEVDLDRRKVLIVATRTRNKSGRWIIGDGPKRESSRREIDMPEICVRLLRQQRRALNAIRLKAPPGWWEEHDLVFPGIRGGIMSDSKLQYQLTALCKDAGVPRITPHGIRHIGATWARTLGEDAEVLQRRLGHANIATTLGTYLLQREGESKSTSERLERALRQPG